MPPTLRLPTTTTGHDRRVDRAKCREYAKRRIPDIAAYAADSGTIHHGGDAPPYQNLLSQDCADMRESPLKR